jgi:spermidine synthase
MIPQIGFFMREFPYPAVLEGGREWMTLMPNETVTTLPAVAAAHGRVVTFGLGLGYFTFHAALSERVESVTVVELSHDAIALFKKHILPQLPNREKVRIVQADAFRYLEHTMKPTDFDFAFADIWHDVGDGRELYRRFKDLEHRFPSTEFTYWLEDTILCYERPELWG